jgi:hypothetical protein
MRVLLDTNIIIHREAGSVVREDIGILFRWLDRMRADKCVHPRTVDEIARHGDPKVVASFGAKLKSYTLLQGESADTPVIAAARRVDTTANDAADTDILKEVVVGRVDGLITEDRGLRSKAVLLGVPDRVYSIDEFLEKANAEYPQLLDYKVLSVRKERFSKIDVRDPFFESLRKDYPFDRWFMRKAEEFAYVCRAEDNSIIAFLYLKIEDEHEIYSDIVPPFRPKKRLKIGTFKVVANGFKLGERFLKIAFDNACEAGVAELYVTAFERSYDQRRLVELLQEWGFERYGTKGAGEGREAVFIRRYERRFNPEDPRLTYPFFSAARSIFIVPIYPAYHTELFPDSILRTESPLDFVESRPNRNAISKAYISRSIERNLKRGDLIVFYRTLDRGHGYFTSVATTLGVVQNVITNFSSVDEFIAACRKRSVFSDQDLQKQWDFKPRYRPFVVNFLYLQSFRKRPNLKALVENGIIKEAPRGFERISRHAFSSLWQISGPNVDTLVD